MTEWCLNPLQNNNMNITLDNKTRLYKLLEEARKQQVHYIVFPEFYLPIIWLDEIVDFSKRTQIGVICGLQYMYYGNKVFNYVANIQPFVSYNKHRYAIPIIREKNNYPRKEKLVLSTLGFKCIDQRIPNYQIYNIEKISYTNLLCFELTDINARANLKTKINILFAPEYNPDTNYFSSIVTSTSRDLHCFIVQVNTSNFGDSRITAPYNTESKNLVQLKGGCNDVLLVGEVNIGELMEFQHTYHNKMRNQIRDEWEKNEVPPEKGYKIKDLPAAFD